MHPANNFQLPTIFRLGSGGQHPTNSVEALKGNCTKKISKKLNGVKKRKTGRAEIVQCHDSASCGGYAIQLGECCGQHTLYLVITTHTHTHGASRRCRLKFKQRPQQLHVVTAPSRQRPPSGTRQSADMIYAKWQRYPGVAPRAVAAAAAHFCVTSGRRCAPEGGRGRGGEQTLNESGRVRLFNDAI